MYVSSFGSVGYLQATTQRAANRSNGIRVEVKDKAFDPLKSSSLTAICSFAGLTYANAIARWTYIYSVDAVIVKRR